MAEAPAESSGERATAEPPARERETRSAVVRLAVRRPVTIFIGAVAAIVFGLVAFGELATDLLPDVTYPSLTIRTELPGAAPLEVENLVTRPVEDAVGVVGNLLRVESSSRAEISEVTLEFGWGTSMDFAALDVRERLDVLRLPLDAEPPILLRYDPSLDPILRLAVAAGGERADAGPDELIHLRLVAEERVKRPLERLEGVAAVLVQGGLEEEVQVEIDERRLAGLGLGIDLVTRRLAEENVDVSGGELREGQSRFMVRTVGEILRPEELEDIVIGRVATAGAATDAVGLEAGALVRLRDVADVRRGHEERQVITRLDGREAVEVAVYKAGGTNTVRVSRRVREQLAEIRADLQELDPDLRIEVVTDQAGYIESSVREVMETAAWGGVLAILVLFLFLRSWKSTAIIGVSIPISVIATFFLMYAFDISLNIMSLGGLTLGIGLLVDNAIVVLESIARRREEGADVEEAAVIGASKVALAVAAATFTTICVFLPIIFVEGVAAQFFADQALTVTFSLLVSLVVALTVIPMLASRRAPSRRAPRLDEEEMETEDEEDVEGDPLLVRWTVKILRALGRVFGVVLRPLRWLLDRPAAAFQRGFEVLARGYGRFLDAALDRPFVVVALAAVVFGLSLPLYSDLGRELVPELRQGEFFVELELEPGTHLDVTERRMAALERRALELDGVGKVYSIIGSSGREGGLAGENREYLGRITIEVAPPFSRQKEERLMEQMREIVARDASGKDAVDARFGRPSYFSFQKPVEIELRGFNLTLLRRLSDDLVAELRATPGFEDVESTAEGGTPELQVRFDRERLASYGLTVQDVAEVLRTKVQGDIASAIQRQDRTIDIRVRAGERFRDSVQDLRQLVVHQQDGVPILLTSVAEIAPAEGPAEIRRVDGERAALIASNLVGLDLASAEGTIERLVDELRLPAGFDWRLGGQQREMERSFDSMRLAIALAIFLVYLVMASQFESLLHPFVILGSVPLSLVGVLWTLWLFDVRLSVVVLIGVVLLAGIVVNNAILLVDTANRHRQEGATRLEAIRIAGRLRLRPILMTTLTTCLGLLPMAIGLGEGAELRSPMALTVIGGLLVSTLLTLVVIPAVYRLLER